MMGVSFAAPQTIKHIDAIVIHKAKRHMTVSFKGKELKTYIIALGSSPVGPKRRQGDGKTPEGVYRVAGKNAHSRFHLSLRISYPNKQDMAYAQKARIKDPGGDIMIHGLAPAHAHLGWLHRFHDWTLGCIAVTNAEIEEVFRATPVGTPVTILP
jgi:murein L,D-transpeptidase YafK